jgi:hypothetical protein
VETDNVRLNKKYQVAEGGAEGREWWCHLAAAENNFPKEEKRDAPGIFEMIRGVMDATDIEKNVRLSLQQP